MKNKNQRSIAEKTISKEVVTHRTFLFSIFLTIFVVMGAIFFIMVIRSTQLIEDAQLSHAQAYMELIQITRMWNADNGGVYTIKKEGEESHPLLKSHNKTLMNGEELVFYNPALMTRKISEYTKKYDSFSFHITSLNPINPENRPDDFEKKALLAIEDGAKEFSTIIKKDNKVFYRHVTPLYVKDFCLNCHAGQGYKIDEVRGGISIITDITEIKEERYKSILFILLVLGSSLFFLISLVWYFSHRLFSKFITARKEIEELAIRDCLTNLYNRRYIMEVFNHEWMRSQRQETELSCIMMDIDDFKKVNDTYGHELGDKVLQEVAMILTKTVRISDPIGRNVMAGRYGGEEFLIVVPDTNVTVAMEIAERIRTIIEATAINDIDITCSLGVT